MTNLLVGFRDDVVIGDLGPWLVVALKGVFQKKPRTMLDVRRQGGVHYDLQSTDGKARHGCTLGQKGAGKM